MKKILLLVGVLLFCIPGCTINQKKKRKRDFMWVEQEARLHDIPVLLHARPISLTVPKHEPSLDSSDIGMKYNVSGITLHEAQVFYLQEMERLGWESSHTFILTEEMLLLFQKPHSSAAISLRPKVGNVHVVVFVQRK